MEEREREKEDREKEKRMEEMIRMKNFVKEKIFFFLMGKRDRDNDVKEKRRGLYKRRRKRKEKGKWITREVTEIMMNKGQRLLKIKKR